jgi:hypothetical protein
VDIDNLTALLAGRLTALLAGRLTALLAGRLAALLAGRLAAIVPPGFHVDAADGMLWYSADEGRFPGQQGDYRVGRSGTHVRENLGVAEADADADAITAITAITAAAVAVAVAVQALDELQDYVSEATHDPWPGTTTQPRPHAEIRDAALHLWYAHPDNITLTCLPIPIAALIRPLRTE